MYSSLSKPSLTASTEVECEGEFEFQYRIAQYKYIQSDGSSIGSP